MVIEESLIFITNKYSDNNFIDQIEITFKLLSNNTIEMEMTNIGPPIHLEKIPVFDIEDPNTADGLWFEMVKKLVNKFEFINKLRQGWLIKISKCITNISFSQADLAQNETNKTAPLGEVTIRLAVPDDATALVDLAYSTYRYTYNVASFYDSDTLKKQILNGTYDIYVAQMNNKIIGSTSMKYFNPEAPFGETGSAMVIPEYRRSSAILLLIRAIALHHTENPRNKDFFLCELITTHTLSQRAVSRINQGYKPLSISLNLCQRSEYLAIDEKTKSLEALLNMFYFVKKLNVSQIFTTESNKEMVKELISNTDNEIEVSTESAVPVSAESKILMNKTNSTGAQILRVESLGINWISDIRKKIYNLTTSDVKTIIINIPSGTPLPPNFDEQMINLNLIFCGLFLNSLEDITLYYMFTTSKVDFDSIKLDSPVAKNLLEHIKNQYKIIAEE